MSRRETKHFNSLNQITNVWPNQWGLFWFPSRWWLEVEMTLKFGARLLPSELHLTVAMITLLTRRLMVQASPLTGYGWMRSTGEQVLCKSHLDDWIIQCWEFMPLRLQKVSLYHPNAFLIKQSKFPGLQK